MRNKKIIVNGKERTIRFNTTKLCFECNVGYKDNQFKQQSRVIRGESLQELTENIVQFENRLAQEMVNQENITFNAFSMFYFDNIAPIDNAISTVELKKNIYRKIPDTIKCSPLKDLTTLMLQSFYTSAYTRYASNTVYSFYELIGTILNRAIDYEYIKVNPNKKCVIKPRTPGKKVYWSVDTCKQFLEFLANSKRFSDLYKPVYFAMITGARRGEVIGLRYEFIDFDRKLVNLRGQIKQQSHSSIYSDKLKTPKSKRSIKLPDDMFDEIFGASPKANGFVFLHKGKEWHYHTFYDRCKTAFIKFGYPNMQFKHLRSSFVKTSIQNNVPLKAVQVLLGHSKLSTTADIYGELTSEDTFQYADNISTAWSKVS